MPRILVVAGAIVAAALVAAAWAAPAARSRAQAVSITLRAGDRVDEPNVALAPGVPVRVTVTNETREFHTFTVPGLGVSELVRPAGAHAATRTTFTFTANRWGAFAWHCLVCPSDAHGRPHAMGGTLYAITDPSALR